MQEAGEGCQGVQAFSSAPSQGEDWCRKCNPNLPIHKHQRGGSLLVKTAEGTKELLEITYGLVDGKELKISFSNLFRLGLGPILLGQPLPPMADMEDMDQFLDDSEDAFYASLTETGACTFEASVFRASTILFLKNSTFTIIH